MVLMRPPPLPATASRPKIVIMLGLWLDGSFIVPVTGHCPARFARRSSFQNNKSIRRVRCFSDGSYPKVVPPINLKFLSFRLIGEGHDSGKRCPTQKCACIAAWTAVQVHLFHQIYGLSVQNRGTKAPGPDDRFFWLATSTPAHRKPSNPENLGLEGFPHSASPRQNQVFFIWRGQCRYSVWKSENKQFRII